MSSIAPAPRRHLRASVVVLVLLLAASAVLIGRVGHLVQDQEERLLRERAGAAALILSSSIGNIEPQLGQLGTAAQVADLAPNAFLDVAGRQMATTKTIRALSVVRTAEAPVVELVVGTALGVGQTLDGPRADAVRRASETPRMVTTVAFRDGSDLVLGFAVGPPTAAPGTVLYRENVILPGTPTRSTGSAPFADLKGELYAGPLPVADQLVLATATRPMPGDRTFEQKLPVGDSEWLFVAAADRPLAGTLVARLPWLVAIACLAGSLLIAAMIEGLSRRRDYALALVDKRTAELRESLDSLEVARAEAAVARDQAMEGSRLKSQFLANMSHEIRTPLNGVIGMTGLLIDTRLDPEQREFAETARRSGESLLELINDVLDFSKIEAGKLELETSDFDLGAVVEDVAELFAATAQQNGLEITASTDPDLPTSVSGDPGRVRQVLTNLVSNAVKFTHRGEVAITVERDTDGDRPMVRFSVRDTGVGVGEDGPERLFEAFTQADASTTRRYGGTGLGLAISKRLAELMGGTVGVESPAAGGSTFWFAIPLVVAAGGGTSIDRQALAGVRVLIVDDNATNRTVLERQMSAWAVESVSAADGTTGLEALRQAASAGRPFAVALVDWHMPGMDGIDVARALAADPSLDGTKVVMLTSVTSHVARERVAASLTKPVRRSQLFDAIAAASGVGSRPPAGDIPGPAAITAWHAPSGRRILVAEDNPVNQRVVSLMLRRLGFRVDVVGNGAEAVAALVELPYDLVLMDCQMPVMNGYEATAAIREGEAPGHRVPIVALTASALKGDKERCIEAGMDDYLAKPVHIDDLAAVLRSFLVGPPAAPEMVEADEAAHVPEVPTEAPAPPAAADVVLDRDAYERIRALGEDFLFSITADFREDAPNDIGELKQALADADPRRVMGVAHRLKGGCLILGANRMGTVAGEIEGRADRGHLDQVPGLVADLERSYVDLLVALASANAA
jgi:signal transduction histidine kinase/DNA-binding response OmpR family regulator